MMAWWVLFCAGSADTAKPQEQLETRQGFFRGQPVTYQVAGGVAVLEGDIVMGTAAEIDEAQKHQNRRDAAIHPDLRYRWPDGVVPYVIDADLPEQERVTRAIREWNEKTIIRLVPRAGHSDYVRFRRGGGSAFFQCNSALGRIGGEQIVTVGDGCGKESNLHEIGHALGLWHETQRADRDEWIKLNYHNIDKRNVVGGHGQRIGPSADAGPYDYGSVMHYGAYFDSFNGRPVIESTPPGIPIWFPYFSFVLSTGVVETVRSWYRPSNDTVLDTHPSGLELIVDGERVRGLRRFAWAQGSVHRVEAPMPQGSGNTRYLFGSWSDRGERIHEYRVPAGGLLIANFIRQYRVQTMTAPGIGGAVRIDPASPDGFYTEGARLTITATPAEGYAFESWYGKNDLFTSRQGQGSNPATFYLYSPEPAVGAGFRQIGREVVTTLTTNPPGLEIQVDGRRVLGPFRPNNWPIDSEHTVSAATHVGPSGPVRYVFTGWSDGGPATRRITHSAPGTTYVANFKVQHLLVINNSSRGTITAVPQGDNGFYDEGARVELRATPQAGMTLSHWTWDAQGNTSPVVLTMNEHKAVGAVFAGASTRPQSQLSAPLNVYLTAVEGEIGPGYEYPVFSGEIRASFVIEGSAPWLQISATSGQTPATVILAANAAGLAAGNYRTSIRVGLPGTAAGPQTVNVTLAVAARGPAGGNAGSRIPATSEPAPALCRMTARSGLHAGPTDYSDRLQLRGTVRAAMLFVDFVDAPASETPESLVELLVPESQRWFQEVSYGKVDLQVVTPALKWYRMSQPSNAYVTNGGFSFEQHARYIGEAIRLADGDVDLSVYQVVYIVASRGAALRNSPTWIPAVGQGIQADGVEVRHVVTFGEDVRFSSPNYASHILTHETGHLAGLPDLYLFGAADFFSSHDAVGAWDNMGWIGPGAHFLAWQKEKLGWLEEAQVNCVADGEVEDLLSPLSSPGGVKMLAAPVSPTQVLVAEVRDRTAQDGRLCDEGVLVYKVDTSIASGAGPIVVQRAGAGDDEQLRRRCGPGYDAPYGLGEGKRSLFTDAASGVSFEVLEKTGSSYRVRVRNTLRFNSLPLLSSPRHLVVEANAGSEPLERQLAIGASGGPLKFRAIASEDWISVSPEGEAPAALVVRVNPGELGPGTYHGSILLEAAGAANSPRRIMVELKIREPE
jgi:M6 family metalloprotease-like protein